MDRAWLRRLGWTRRPVSVDGWLVTGLTPEHGMRLPWAPERLAPSIFETRTCASPGEVPSLVFGGFVEPGDDRGPDVTR